MSSSARRGQVEPLPALIALAVFGIGLTLYGTTLQSVQLAQPEQVPDATVTTTLDTLSEGTVIHPDRLHQLDSVVPEGTSVVIRADGQTWRWGPEAATDAPTTRRHVLVQTETGAIPGTLRVSI